MSQGGAGRCSGSHTDTLELDTAMMREKAALSAELRVTVYVCMCVFVCAGPVSLCVSQLCTRSRPHTRTHHTLQALEWTIARIDTLAPPNLTQDKLGDSASLADLALPYSTSGGSSHAEMSNDSPRILSQGCASQLQDSEGRDTLQQEQGSSRAAKVEGSRTGAVSPCAVSPVPPFATVTRVSSSLTTPPWPQHHLAAPSHPSHAAPATAPSHPSYAAPVHDHSTEPPPSNPPRSTPVHQHAPKTLAFTPHHPRNVALEDKRTSSNVLRPPLPARVASTHDTDKSTKDRVPVAWQQASFALAVQV
jgi:hypothetical protein